MKVNNTDSADPTTAQNGITNPTKIRPGSRMIPVGVAGMMPCVTLVSSNHGIGRIWMGLARKMLVSTGTPTLITPKTNPITVPIENKVQRQLFCPLSPSANAMTPWAPTGAIGKGSFSTSDVRRKSA